MSKVRSASIVLALCGMMALATVAWAVYETGTPQFADPGYTSVGNPPTTYGAQFGIRNLSMYNHGPYQNPPAPGTGYNVSSFFDVFTELTLDGGNTWLPVATLGGVTIHVQNNQPDFDTEMLQLDLAGGGLPAGVMIRESPTLQSLGKTKIDDVGGGLFRIDSFFDVFTELSVDGGQSWQPASAPMAITGIPEPATLAMLGGSLLLMLARRRRN